MIFLSNIIQEGTIIQMTCSTNHKNCLASKLTTIYNLTFESPEKKIEILNHLDNHIDAMLYNISSIASVTALLDEKIKIELKHIDFVKKYITKQCSSKNGKNTQSGGSFPAEYFGYNSGAYTESNYGGVNTDVVWSGSDAAIRPELNMSGGSGGSLMKNPKDIIGNNTHVSKYMKQVISFNDVKITKSAMDELLKLVNIHLNCLGNDIKSLNKLKVSSLDKLFKSHKHAVFK